MADSLIIERVEVFGVAIPLERAFKTAHSEKSVQRSIIVRITAAGRTGLGNIDPSPGYSKETIEDDLQVLHEHLVPRVIGLDASNVHQIMHVMDCALVGFLDAKAAIEMACVDLSARARDIPVHTWLGGAVKTDISFNAWIGILPPDQAAEEAQIWFRKGFRSAKIKVGGNIEADRNRIFEIRQAVGSEMALRIDANAGYDAETSIQLARRIEPFDIQLFEQPVPAHDLSGMARVGRATGIPIMADESVLDHASLIRIIETRSADIVKLKVMKQGGLLSTRRMVATCEAAGIRCVIGHGFGLGVNTMAEIMLAATSENVMDGLECVGPLKTSDDIVTHKLDLSGGSIALPSGPGLAVQLDSKKLARYCFGTNFN